MPKKSADPRESKDRSADHRLALGRQLLDQAPVGLMLSRLDGSLVDVNQAFADLLGRTIEEVRKLSIWDITPADWSGEDDRQLEQIHRTGRFGPYEKEFVHRDGHRIPVRLTGRVIELDGQRYMWSAADDIVDRKTADAVSAARIETLGAMEAVNRVIVTTDDPWRAMRKVLDELLKIFGCDRASLVYPCDPKAESCSAIMEQTRHQWSGPPLEATTIPMTRPIAATMTRLLDVHGPFLEGPTHEPLDQELVDEFSLSSTMSIAIRPKLGEPWMLVLQYCEQHHDWSESEARLFETLAGRIGDSLTSLISMRDLRDSEARMRTVVEHAPEAIVVLDIERDCFTEANANALDLFKLSREELYQRSPIDVSPTTQPDGRDSREAASEYILRAIAGETPIFEWTHQSSTGLHIPCEIRLVKLPSADRTLVRGSMTDISERKRAEQELALYRNHLEELVELRTHELERSRQKLLTSERLASLGTLAAGIAHQLNNPVGSILNGAEFALLSAGDAEQDQIWQRVLEDNVEQAARCGRIIKSILLFSRGEPAEKRVEDLAAVLRQSCELASRHARKSGASIECDLPAGRIPVLMSQIELEQVFINLIHNAVESRDEGARVQVRASVDQETVRIDVRDDGQGISPDVLSKIFDPFFTTRLGQGGTGLGLSVAHGIVSEHAGSIDVDSKPGEGTTMSVSLTLAAEEWSDRAEGI